MAACAIEVMGMIHGYKSIEDIAADRLDEWNRWMNAGPPVGPAQPTCTLGRVLEQRVAAGSQGAPRKPPMAVDEVERVVRTFSAREKKLITTWYDRNPVEIKAKECGLSRSGYHRAIRRMQRHLYSMLY